MRDTDRLLTPLELALIILAVLPIFAFLGGPIWNHPYQIDAAVYWSYAPIPLLVLFVLFRRQVLSFSGFLVNTVTALSVKYMVTTTVAFVFWTAIDPPALASATSFGTAHVTAESSPKSPVGEGAPVIDFGAQLSGNAYEVSAGAPLIFRSVDGQLHTARGVREDGSLAFNRPVIPGRAFEPLELGREGKITVRCAVHEHEGAHVLSARR